MIRIALRPWVGFFAALLIVFATPSAAFSQLGGLRDIAGRAAERLPDWRDLIDDPPITTSLSQFWEARWIRPASPLAQFECDAKGMVKFHELIR